MRRAISAFAIVVLSILTSCQHGTTPQRVAERLGDEPSPSSMPSPSLAPTAVPTTDPETPSPVPVTPAPTPSKWSKAYDGITLELSIDPVQPHADQTITFTVSVNYSKEMGLDRWRLDPGNGQGWGTINEYTKCPTAAKSTFSPYGRDVPYEIQLPAGTYHTRLEYEMVTCQADGSSTSGPDAIVEGDYTVAP